MPKRSGRRLSGVISTVATILFAACTAMAARADHLTATVHVATGDLQGKVVAGVDEFLGIPYAAPPVGDLRWRPPAAPASWSGTRRVTAFANTCAQASRGIFAAPSNTEDCLYLNVFAPHASNAKAKLPVMVWFYGGGLFSGESNDYDGSKLAERGNVIVVTLNFRVGALGFLSVPSLNGEGHPHVNYGIMDQQAALRWVKQNIANFGGDAGKVTIFGQSGGGTAVMANLQSPTAKGLFQRAINESGTHITIVTPEEELKAGEAFAKQAGCPDAAAACLRSLSVKQIFAHQGPVVHLVTEFPSADGTVITDDAPHAFRTGNFNHVPIMTGLVEDEQSFFMPETQRGAPALTAEGYEKFLESFGAPHKDALAQKYPVSKFESPTLAEVAVAQKFKACTAHLLDDDWTKYVPVYAYEFRDRTAPSYYPPTSFPMRAYHTAELLYLFPLFHGGQGTPHPLNSEQERLSDLIVDYWASFARNGVPTAKAGDLSSETWTRYSAQSENIQGLELTGGHQHSGYGRMHDCSFWADILPYK
jgi:para-nitrobenzyl esterase